MDTQSFLKDKVAPFRDISNERLQTLVDGSRAVSFEANEAIMHCGAEATHFGVVLSGEVNRLASCATLLRHTTVTPGALTGTTKVARWPSTSAPFTAPI